MKKFLSLFPILSIGVVLGAMLIGDKPGSKTPGAMTDYTAKLLIELDRQADETVQIWPAGTLEPIPDGLTQKIVHRDNRFGLVDRAVHEVTHPDLSIFKPAEPNGTAILLIPGGGYRWVVADKEGYEGARLFNKFGATVYVLNYRLPHHGWSAGPDTPLQDAQRAARVIRARAERDNIDPKKLLLMGFSAGGHLGGSLITRFDVKTYEPVDAIDTLSARPDASVLVYPVITLAKPFTHYSTSGNMIGENPTADLVQAYSVETRVPDNAPPTMVLHATDDKSVPVENALLIYNSLRKAGIDASLHVFGSGGHGFGLRGIDEHPLRMWPWMVVEWARQFNLFEN